MKLYNLLFLRMQIRSDGNCLYSAIGDQLVASGEIVESVCASDHMTVQIY